MCYKRPSCNDKPICNNKKCCSPCIIIFTILFSVLQLIISVVALQSLIEHPPVDWNAVGLTLAQAILMVVGLWGLATGCCEYIWTTAIGQWIFFSFILYTISQQVQSKGLLKLDPKFISLNNPVSPYFEDLLDYIQEFFGQILYNYFLLYAEFVPLAIAGFLCFLWLKVALYCDCKNSIESEPKIQV